MTTEQIFETLGLQDAPIETKAKILANITSAADLQFARVVDEVMTDDERQEFESFAEGKGPAEISKWVAAKYEGIGEMYDGIIEQIVADMKSRNLAA